MRREWIEIDISSLQAADRQSPSMRREWIEIVGALQPYGQLGVSLHAEGVD